MAAIFETFAFVAKSKPLPAITFESLVAFLALEESFVVGMALIVCNWTANEAVVSDSTIPTHNSGCVVILAALNLTSEKYQGQPPTNWSIRPSTLVPEIVAAWHGSRKS
jgi:hypothetical protein